jgi:hypothetical protein
MKYFKKPIWLLVTVTVITLISVSGLSFVQAQPENKPLLRHVVLIEFNEQFSDSILQDLVTDVYAMKKSIPQINDLEWGENIKEGSEYTYCLLMSFRTENDLEEYQAHPEHNSFAAKYGPYVSKLTEIDYWSNL